jgi:hypothetical protein
MGLESDIVGVLLLKGVILMATLLRKPEVLSRLGISKSTLTRWVASGFSPPPVQIGQGRLVGMSRRGSFFGEQTTKNARRWGMIHDFQESLRKSQNPLTSNFGRSVIKTSLASCYSQAG